MNNLDNIFNPNSTMSEDEYKNGLVDIVRDILAREFPDDRQRQIVKICHNRLQFCCPCCGDSATDSNKKRGNIGLEGKWTNLYKCFNCGVSMPVSEFLKKYYKNRIPLQMIDRLSSNKIDKDSSIQNDVNTSIEIFDQENIDRYAIPRETFKQLLGLDEVDGTTWNYGHEYLKNRLQFDWSKFLYSHKGNRLYVLNLTRSGKIFGVQIRTLGRIAPGEAKYKTYNLSNIYGILLKNHLKLNVGIPQEIDGLSMIFNSLTIDYGKPVIVVEGPMDAFLLKNAIATCGAAKEVPFSANFKYLYDDDDAGRTHAIEKIKSNRTVFLWDKFKKENDIPSAKKWDVNDIFKYCSNTNKKFNFYNQEYWSDDMLDLVMI